MTTPDDGGYDPGAHLSFCDIAVDDPSSPSFLRVRIKQSKTDPFRKGVDLFLGRTGSDICPVAALLGYLACRGSRPVVYLCRRSLADSEEVCGFSTGGTGIRGGRSAELLRTQLPYRRSYYGGGQRDRRLCHQVARKVGKCRLPPI